MKSLFNEETINEMIARINRLNSCSKAAWGKMSVDQMVAHAQVGLRVAFGEIKLKRVFIGYLFGAIAKKQITNSKPFGKNLPTDKSFIIAGHPELEAEKKKLIELVQRFAKVGPEGITKEPHPFFGKMTSEEWDALMFKHLDHHLRQFGA